MTYGAPFFFLSLNRMLIAIWFLLAGKPETWGDFLICPKAVSVALAGTLLGCSGRAEMQLLLLDVARFLQALHSPGHFTAFKITTKQKRKRWD